MTELPRSIRDVSPGPEFEKIERDRPDGLPDGKHTGGAWVGPGKPFEREVWKPLDGGNAHDGPHYPTQEAECLEEMAGQVGFPRNWRVEERNGRRWLVRKEAAVYGQTCPLDFLSLEHVLEIEKALKALNAAGWEIGDDVSVAEDPDSYELFILDLSCASKAAYTTNSAWDDEWRYLNFLTEAKYDALRLLREAGRRQIHDILFDRTQGIPRDWQWIYASRSRPMSLTWANKLRGKAHLIAGNYPKDRVHTWIVTEGPLDDDTIYDYELTFAWAPWETPARKKGASK